MSGRREICEVLLRHATGIDGRDRELFHACFTEDCAREYGDPGVGPAAPVCGARQ